jgi:hypothetical protein
LYQYLCTKVFLEGDFILILLTCALFKQEEKENKTNTRLPTYVCCS